MIKWTATCKNFVCSKTLNINDQKWDTFLREEIMKTQKKKKEQLYKKSIIDKTSKLCTEIKIP